jgi:hypothetical protein
LLLVILVFLAMVASHVDVIPFWDAKSYLYCVEDAVRQPFDLVNFRCAGHPVFYALLWGLTQYLSPWDPTPMYAVNAVLGVAAIIAFDALLRLLFPHRGGAEYALVTALFAAAPLLVAHAIFLNLDYGVTIVFVLFLHALLAGRFWLASAFAVAVIFTKETGTAVYAVTLTAYTVAFMRGTRRPWPQPLAALRSHLPLAVPPLILAAYVVVVAIYRPDPMGWANSYAPVGIVTNRLQTVLNTNLADPGIRSFLADIFVLNFQWLYTAVIVASVCVALVGVERPHVTSIEAPRLGIFFALTLTGLVYVVTRYWFTNSARYVLLTLPIVVLMFYHALVSLFANRGARLLYLSVCVALVVASNFRTIDVVSMAAFGTFPFGSHALLDMPSLTGGLKLDSMVYNLEFVQLQYLFGEIVQDLRPRPGAVLLMGNAIYNFPPDVDGRSYALTANPSHALPLFVAIGDVSRDTLATHLQHDGELFYYVAFPNADNVQLAALSNAYPLVATKKYERHGYTLELSTFRFVFTS